MTIKLFGGALIMIACGAFGFYLAMSYKKEERNLRQLLRMVEYLSCELQYRMTPLPQLCRQGALECSGTLKNIFLSFADEMDKQVSADARTCMNTVLARYSDLPVHSTYILQQLANCLGRFDLAGQIKDLQMVSAECEERRSEMIKNKDSRLRIYQALGLCAGAALAILLI